MAEKLDLIEKLSKIEDFPTIPTSFARILEVAEDINSTFKDMVAIVETDPALAGKVLKVANSPLYGFAREISSIERAVVLLGFNEVRFLALGLSAFDTMFRKVRGTYFQRQRFWTHAYSTAMVGRQLAGKFGIGEQVYAFVAGLLHDMGKVILDRYFPELFVKSIEIMRQISDDFLVCEQACMGIGHDEVGAYVAERWNLPASLVAAVKGHHNPGENPSPLADLTYLANGIVHLMGIHCMTLENTPELTTVLEDPNIVAMQARRRMAPGEINLLIEEQLGGSGKVGATTSAMS